MDVGTRINTFDNFGGKWFKNSYQIIPNVVWLLQSLYSLDNVIYILIIMGLDITTVHQ